MANVIFKGGLAFGAALGYWGTRTAVVAAASTSVAIPVGVHIVETDAHTTVRVSYDAGTSWITLVGTSAVGMVASDGVECEIRGDGTGGTAQRSMVKGLS